MPNVNEIDKHRLATHFNQALSTYDLQALAQQAINQHLINLLLKYLPEGKLGKVLEIGCGTGDLSQHLLRHYAAQHWLFNDLNQGCAAFIDDLFKQYQRGPYEFMAGDAEQLDLSGTYDLIASASTVQWFSNLPRFISNVAGSLPSGAWFLCSSFAPDNLPEIKTLSGKGLRYADQDQWLDLLAPYFDVHVFEQDEIVLWFDDAFAVLKHLKQTGVTATTQGVWSRARLAEFAQEYQRLFANEKGQVSLSYRPFYILAQRK
ncbi:MAG: malonyl-ACP O-methyltransferase BioC [Pelistega sp.]|nr:malonyl-ACP O-methyltransferase BioC [Pelistega sp.]